MKILRPLSTFRLEFPGQWEYPDEAGINSDTPALTGELVTLEDSAINIVLAPVTGGIKAVEDIEAVIGSNPYRTLSGLTGTIYGAPEIAGDLPNVTGSLTASQGIIADIIGELPEVTGEVYCSPDIAGEFPVLTGEFNAVNGTVGSIDKNLPAITGSFTALNEVIAYTSGNLSALSGEIAAVQENLASIAGNLNGLVGSMQGVKGKVIDLSGSMCALTGSLTAMTETLASIDGSTQLEGELYATVLGRFDDYIITYRRP